MPKVSGNEELIKLPKTDGACADLLYTTRQARYKLQHEVAKLQAVETAIEQRFIDTLSAKDSTGVAGKVGRAQVQTKIVPVVEDWPKLYAHIKKTGEFELMQRRLGETAVKERWDADKQVPGVGRFTAKKVSCTRV
jgi:hypothetical protein